MNECLLAQSCLQPCFLDGYINESGTINTRRLQVVLDEMVSWEQEVFEKEYSDMNWFKGKQSKHVKENGKKQEGLCKSFLHSVLMPIHPA
jgi:5'-3' exonuclease